MREHCDIRDGVKQGGYFDNDEIYTSILLNALLCFCLLTDKDTNISNESHKHISLYCVSLRHRLHLEFTTYLKSATLSSKSPV